VLLSDIREVSREETLSWQTISPSQRYHFAKKFWLWVAQRLNAAMKPFFICTGFSL
jgi:hypothetical protein